MSAFAFVPIDEPGLQLLQSWFVDDELQRRYDRPTDRWLAYVRSQPGVYAWLINEAGVPVGYLQLDTDAAGTGYIGLVVRPDLRKHGYGKRILRALLDRPEVRPLHQIIGSAEADNVASQRCVTAVGFIQQDSQPDAAGFLTFVYHRQAD